MVPHDSDLALAKQCLAGDGDARERLGARFRCIPRILAARNRRLSVPLDDSALQDIAGEVTLQAWNKLAEYHGLAALESWLYRFCEFTLLNAVRRGRREQAHAIDEATAATQVERDDIDNERLHQAMERLPDDELGVVRAKHFDGLTFEEIAARMAIPLTTAKGRYYRALERLRHRLGAAGLEVGR